MANPSSHRNAMGDSGVGPGSAPTTGGAPRWVKVSGIIAIVLALLFVILLLAGGEHGPGRHATLGDASRAGITQYESAGDHVSLIGSRE
jgi:hypothetical protein